MPDAVVRHLGPKAYADHPPFSYPAYRSTVKRAPVKDLVRIVTTVSESTGPGPAWAEAVGPTEADADLTTNAGTGAAAIGQRIIVTGRVLDQHGTPLPGTLLEIWQANASGRYVHWRETAHDAPLDPNFLGVGQCLTDDAGVYRFLTVRPGPRGRRGPPDRDVRPRCDRGQLGDRLPLGHRDTGSAGDATRAGRLMGETPSQTVGPYFAMRMSGDGHDVLVSEGTPGQRIRVQGHVVDGDDRHIEDALVEVWRANAAGRYRHPADARDDIALDDGFIGFGRAASDFDTGAWSVTTVKPGRVPGPDGGLQAPHLNLIVQARGMLLPTFTRVYFADEADANAVDPVLAQVAAERRGTLIAEVTDDGDPTVYEFDIVYQGDDETVFFDI